MANCDSLFKEFDANLQIPQPKKDQIRKSNKALRDQIRNYFKKEHPEYKPTFYIQGSSKIRNRIRTKDDTCDQDDGVYFKANPENVTGTTLQKWVKDAVDGTTDATPSHRKKCITVDYKAGYNIDLPVFLFDKDKDSHPKLAVKNEDFKMDDPKEFVEEFNRRKDSNGQLVRITRFLKAWCDNKREKMPNGLSMTVLAMKYYQKHDRDDISFKYTLTEIERNLKVFFSCVMPTTPYDDLFAGYDEDRRKNFMNNLADLIADAKTAVDAEENQLNASKLWRDHLGKTYFPEGKDVKERSSSAALLTGTIGTARPYHG